MRLGHVAQGQNRQHYHNDGGTYPNRAGHLLIADG